MKHLFQVTIRYAEGTRSEYNIAAFTDAQARKLAINKDYALYKSGNTKHPAVEYCEINHLCIIDADIEKS